MYKLSFLTSVVSSFIIQQIHQLKTNDGFISFVYHYVESRNFILSHAKYFNDL